MLTTDERAEAQRLCDAGVWTWERSMQANALLPKALAHITAQEEQLRQALAEGAVMLEALSDAESCLDPVYGHDPTMMCKRIQALLADFTPAITAYAERVAKREEALRIVRDEEPQGHSQPFIDRLRKVAQAALEGER